MKIELLPTDEFVELNKLQPVSSPVLFQRGEVPHPEGLVSNEIFGVTIRDRKETYAYIDLHGHFFHPHIYKVIKRFFRNIDRIINGTEKYSIDKEGHLILDEENGHTGIEFIYDNWNKIKWEYSDSTIRNERIDLIMNSNKKEIFISKQIVIPPFYRDISSSSKGGGSVQDVNNMYVSLIRLATLLRDKDMFQFSFYSTAYSMQQIIVNIYNYFKEKLEKKNGILRKYLMGKNVDNCTRTVITAATFHAEKPTDMQIDFKHVGVPISQACSLVNPFVVSAVKRFFEREYIINKEQKNVVDRSGNVIDVVEIDSPESYFSDKYIKQKINQYIKDPETRFDPIEIPLTNGKTGYATFHGKIFHEGSKDEVAGIANRKMTWTDLLYMASVEATKDKHCIVTRYPVSDKFGIFIGGITILSTRITEPMQVGETIYPFYPKIDLNLPKNIVAGMFIDSTQFSHSYLEGLVGDYDGDQTTIKIIWTQEANAECEKVIESKSYFLSTSGSLIRTIGNEAMQTFYSLTKAPGEKNRTITSSEREELISLKPEDLTFTKLVELFADKETGASNNKKPRFEPGDKMTINTMEFCKNTQQIKTTVGRFIFNKILVEGCKFSEYVNFINDEVTKKVYKKFESQLSDMLLQDKISCDTMRSYLDTRDWLGLQLHAVVTISFTMNTISIHPEVQKLKDELIKKYAKEIEAGDPKVASLMEQALIKKTKEMIGDDVGLDLYKSGARGSFDNNFKNIALMRGAVYNRATGKYEIMTNSLNDGLAIKDIPISANTIMEGAYPKAVGTAVSGYMAKKLLASCQTEILDEKGSDCGAKHGINILITDFNKNSYKWRYIMVNGKPVLLNDANINNYVGKVVNLRSPMACIGKCICNKCAGDFYYMIGDRSIGLSASKIGNTLTNLNMKKFHDNVVKFSKIDINDMFL